MTCSGKLDVLCVCALQGTSCGVSTSRNDCSLVLDFVQWGSIGPETAFHTGFPFQLRLLNSSVQSLLVSGLRLCPSLTYREWLQELGNPGIYTNPVV